MPIKGKIYLPMGKWYFLLYFLLSMYFLTWIISLFQVVAVTFLGLPIWFVILIVLLSLFGSFINIPLFHVSSYRLIMKPQVIRIFFVDWVIPSVEWEEQRTLVALNLGGGLIPTLLSVYILFRFAAELKIFLLVKAIIAIIISSIIINRIAKPVPGLGIATPALAPPLVTFIIVILLHPYPNTPEFFSLLYSVGSLSALIGADIMNIKKIPELGAPVASIGGAGTFDGVFLTGLLAIWLAMIFL